LHNKPHSAETKRKISKSLQGKHCLHHSEEYFKKRKEEIEKEGWKILSYTIFDQFPDKSKIILDIKNIGIEI